MSSTRRSFLKQVTLTAVATPFILSSRSRAAAEAGPNSLINMAFIGLGIQNRGLLNHFLVRLRGWHRRFGLAHLRLSRSLEDVAPMASGRGFAGDFRYVSLKVQGLDELLASLPG